MWVHVNQQNKQYLRRIFDTLEAACLLTSRKLRQVLLVVCSWKPTLSINLMTLTTWAGRRGWQQKCCLLAAVLVRALQANEHSQPQAGYAASHGASGGDTSHYKERETCLKVPLRKSMLQPGYKRLMSIRKTKRQHETVPNYIQL